MKVNRRNRAWLLAALAGVLTALLSGALVWRLDSAHLQSQRASAALLAAERAAAIQGSMERAFSAAYALAALVRQGGGAVPEFTEVATQMLPFYPGVGSLQLAQGGVVSQIVPLAGNEKAIGHNLLADPARTKEAFLALETGQLTLAGPFTLLQGGLGAVARLPVFLGADTRRANFWGFVVVLLRFPQALKPAQLPQLTERGYHYALWRTHPDTGQQQVIASNTQAALPNPVSHTLTLPNGTWQLDVSPAQGWGDPAGRVVKGALALLFSLLLAGLVKLWADGRRQGQLLEVRVAQRTQDLQRFAEVTAHHLQEPTRRLASYAERLTRQLHGRLDDPQARLSLDFIGQQARRLKSLLTDVERYLAADQPRGALQLTDPAQVLAQVQAELQAELAQARAQVTLGPLLPVWIDAARLKDMLTQALQNALQFARPAADPAGAANAALQIDISAKRVGPMVQLLISDNGPGVEAQYRERVFRVFERLSATGDGTGVGLALIRRVAQSAGGGAWLQASASGGACLVIQLPSRKAA